MSILKEFEKEFQEAYKAKLNDDIDFMNEFCSKWEGKVNIEYIPHFLRLFNDDCLNAEQNEYVLVVIEGVIKDNPKASTEVIMQNLNILVEERAELCISYILSALLYRFKQNIPDLVEALMDVDEKINNKVLICIESRLNKSSTPDSIKSIASEFLVLYNEKKK